MKVKQTPPGYCQALAKRFSPRLLATKKPMKAPKTINTTKAVDKSKAKMKRLCNRNTTTYCDAYCQCMPSGRKAVPVEQVFIRNGQLFHLPDASIIKIGHVKMYSFKKQECLYVALGELFEVIGPEIQWLFEDSMGRNMYQSPLQTLDQNEAELLKQKCLHEVKNFETELINVADMTEICKVIASKVKNDIVCVLASGRLSVKVSGSGASRCCSCGLSVRKANNAELYQRIHVDEVQNDYRGKHEIASVGTMEIGDLSVNAFEINGKQYVNVSEVVYNKLIHRDLLVRKLDSIHAKLVTAPIEVEVRLVEQNGLKFVGSNWMDIQDMRCVVCMLSQDELNIAPLQSPCNAHYRQIIVKQHFVFHSHFGNVMVHHQGNGLGVKVSTEDVSAAYIHQSSVAGMNTSDSNSDINVNHFPLGVQCDRFHAADKNTNVTFADIGTIFVDTGEYITRTHFVVKNKCASDKIRMVNGTVCKLCKASETDSINDQIRTKIQMNADIFLENTVNESELAAQTLQNITATQFHPRSPTLAPDMVYATIASSTCQTTAINLPDSGSTCDTRSSTYSETRSNYKATVTSTHTVKNKTEPATPRLNPFAHESESLKHWLILKKPQATATITSNASSQHSIVAAVCSSITASSKCLEALPNINKSVTSMDSSSMHSTPPSARAPLTADTAGVHDDKGIPNHAFPSTNLSPSLPSTSGQSPLLSPVIPESLTPLPTGSPTPGFSTSTPLSRQTATVSAQPKTSCTAKRANAPSTPISALPFTVTNQQSILASPDNHTTRETLLISDKCNKNTCDVQIYNVTDVSVDGNMKGTETLTKEVDKPELEDEINIHGNCAGNKMNSLSNTTNTLIGPNVHVNSIDLASSEDTVKHTEKSFGDATRQTTVSYAQLHKVQQAEGEAKQPDTDAANPMMYDTSDNSNFLCDGMDSVQNTVDEQLRKVMEENIKRYCVFSRRRDETGSIQFHVQHFTHDVEKVFPALFSPYPDHASAKLRCESFKTAAAAFLSSRYNDVKQRLTHKDVIVDLMQHKIQQQEKLIKALKQEMKSSDDTAHTSQRKRLSKKHERRRSGGKVSAGISDAVGDEMGTDSSEEYIKHPHIKMVLKRKQPCSSLTKGEVKVKPTSVNSASRTVLEESDIDLTDVARLYDKTWLKSSDLSPTPSKHKARKVVKSDEQSTDILHDKERVKLTDKTNTVSAKLKSTSKVKSNSSRPKPRAKMELKRSGNGPDKQKRKACVQNYEHVKKKHKSSKTSSDMLSLKGKGLHKAYSTASTYDESDSSTIHSESTSSSERRIEKLTLRRVPVTKPLSSSSVPRSKPTTPVQEPLRGDLKLTLKKVPQSQHKAHEGNRSAMTSHEQYSESDQETVLERRRRMHSVRDMMQCCVMLPRIELW